MNIQKFILAFKWQMRINAKNSSVWLTVVGFYILFILMFPLSIAPVENILQPVSNGIILSGILLANLLSLDKLFLTDIKESSLYDWLDLGIYYYISAKILAHWIFVFLPLLLITPILSKFLFVAFSDLGFLMLILVLLSFIFLGLGAFVSSLTAGLENANLLVGFILLPLSLPILLLASLSLESYTSGFNFLPSLAFLLAILFLILALAPLAIKVGLKNSLASV